MTSDSPEVPPERSTTTTRRSPDVVGSRPPKLDRGRALRRAAVALVVIVAIVVAVVIDGDDGGPTFTGPAPGDPVTALCRSSDERQSSACASAFFACRDHRTTIVSDEDLRPSARPRQIAAAYVRSDWSDWESPVRDAAGRGCREGLKTDAG